jgi:hypothetical protein
MLIASLTLQSRSLLRRFHTGRFQRRRCLKRVIDMTENELPKSSVRSTSQDKTAGGRMLQRLIRI